MGPLTTNPLESKAIMANMERQQRAEQPKVYVDKRYKTGSGGSSSSRRGQQDQWEQPSFSFQREAEVSACDTPTSNMVYSDLISYHGTKYL